MNKKAYILVGHSNWGKSYTLKELTGNNSRQKYTNINGTNISVKKMSNDDSSFGLLNFIKQKTLNKQTIIIALCPSFEDKNKKTIEIIEELKSKSFSCYFFILSEKYTGIGKIKDEEINELKKYGTIEILTGKLDSLVRASKFKEFIEKHLRSS